MKYTGGCHCTKIRFEVEATIENLVACNCSMCGKKGHLLFFVPENQFKLTSSAETVADYQFGKKTIHHNFCSNCGVSPFGSGTMPDGTKMKSINARCIDDLDISKFSVHNYDGASI